MTLMFGFYVICTSLRERFYHEDPRIIPRNYKIKPNTSISNICSNNFLLPLLFRKDKGRNIDPSPLFYVT